MRAEHFNIERKRAEQSLDVPLNEMVPLASIILFTGITLDQIFHTMYALTLICSFVMMIAIGMYRKKRFEKMVSEENNKNIHLETILP